MINLSDEQEAAFQRAKAGSEDFKRTFETPEGRRVLEGLMRAAHICPGAVTFDPNELAFREGARWIVNSILVNLDVSPDRMRMLMRSSMEVEQL